MVLFLSCVSFLFRCHVQAQKVSYANENATSWRFIQFLFRLLHFELFTSLDVLLLLDLLHFVPFSCWGFRPAFFTSSACRWFLSTFPTFPTPLLALKLPHNRRSSHSRNSPSCIRRRDREKKFSKHKKFKIASLSSHSSRKFQLESN